MSSGRGKLRHYVHALVRANIGWPWLLFIKPRTQLLPRPFEYLIDL